MTNLKMFLYSRALYEYNISADKENANPSMLLPLFVLNNGEKFTLRINGGWAPIQGCVAMCFEKNTLEINKLAHFDIIYVPSLSPKLNTIVLDMGADPIDDKRFSFKEVEEIIEELGGIDYIATMNLAIKNFENNV